MDDLTRSLTATPSQSCVLESGDTLHIHVLRPPLHGDLAELVWWNVIREELVSGEVCPHLSTVYYLGTIDREYAGSMACYTPGDTRDVGVIEFVMTAERHRRKGVADELLQMLIAEFTAEGGQALYLCTANPVAGRLYEKHGFQYLTGDGMRYLGPGWDAFAASWFLHTGPACCRDAHWGDLPRVTALYNHPEPAWLVKDYISDCFHDTRYEQHFVKLLKSVEGDFGIFRVLVSPTSAVVGAGAAVRKNSYYEQHVAEFTFRITPEYMDQAEELIAGVEDAARIEGIAVLQSHVAESDQDQIEIMAENGFQEQGRLIGQLHIETGTVDLLILRKDLGITPEHQRGRHEYYGGRHPWQRDRLNLDATQ